MNVSLRPYQLEAIERARGLLVGAQPRAVELHTWRPDLYAPQVRRLVPDVELSVGIGVDSEARDVAQGRQSVAAAVAELLRDDASTLSAPPTSASR